MQKKKSTLELMTVIAMLLTLIIFNIAKIISDAEGNNMGRPLKLNGQLKGGRVLISRISGEAAK